MHKLRKREKPLNIIKLISNKLLNFSIYPKSRLVMGEKSYFNLKYVGFVDSSNVPIGYGITIFDNGNTMEHDNDREGSRNGVLREVKQTCCIISKCKEGRNILRPDFIYGQVSNEDKVEVEMYENAVNFCKND